MAANQIQKDQVVNNFNSGERWLAVLGRDAGVAWQTAWSILFNQGLIQKKPGAPGVVVAVTEVVPAAQTEAQEPAAQEPAAQEPEAQAKPSTEFVPPSWYGVLRYALSSEKGACLFGPRGCGKSTAIRDLSSEFGHKTVTMQCAANMQIDSLLGSWTSENGSLRFIDGPLTLAIRKGAWLIAEEANVIHPGVWSLVNTLTDQTGEGLRLPTGEVIHASQEFRLILIYNEGYSGTREVNAALKDRLMPIYAGYLDEEEEVKLLHSVTGAEIEECRQVRGVAEMIRRADLRFDLSPRSLFRWIRLVKEAKLTWVEAYERAVMDLVGPPELAAPQRACLKEIANNTINQWSEVEGN